MLFPGKNDYTGRHGGEYIPRRRRWPLAVGLLTGVLLLCALAWPFLEPFLPEVESVTIQSADLPAVIGQLRIVYVSDIHAGDFYSMDRVAKLVQQINRMKADIVLLGGDYAEDSTGAVAFFHSMPHINARYGVYAVVGNHDRTPPESNLPLLRKAMQAADVIPVINEVVPVPIGSGTIWLAGIDDVSCGHPDLKSVASRVRAEDYVIFLSHSPAIISDALEARDADWQMGWIDLGLFGHTHGGQIGLFGGIVRDTDVPEAYRSGWSHVSRSHLLTSRGIGTSVLPIRLFCRPQIHLITIKAAP